MKMKKEIGEMSKSNRTDGQSSGHSRLSVTHTYSTHTAVPNMMLQVPWEDLIAEFIVRLIFFPCVL